MNRNKDIKSFEGWEIRKICESGYKLGIILQNPNTGEKRKLQFRPCLFSGEYMKAIKEKQ